MCGRYTLATPDPGQIRARFPVGESVPIRRRFNIAPSDEILAVTSDGEGRPRGELLRWGLVPPWSRSPEASTKMINARAETLEERPAYRDGFRRFRCLIIADGFYEWRRAESGMREPFHITRADGLPFAFAGLWARWRREDQPVIRSCTIVTTAANQAVAPLHDRMPVILPQDAEAVWLDAAAPREALLDLLQGIPAPAIALRRVSRSVNDARHDEPDCLSEPLPEDRQPTLF